MSSKNNSVDNIGPPLTYGPIFKSLPGHEKYYIDTEFNEYDKKIFFGLGGTVRTIDLISIALVDENGRELYLISKEFDIEAAWNKWEPRTGQGDMNYLLPKHYWLRENVLKPIFDQLLERQAALNRKAIRLNINVSASEKKYAFNFKNFKRLIKYHGLSKIEIRDRICSFIMLQDYEPKDTIGRSPYDQLFEFYGLRFKPTFIGDFCAYDWVIFCWLFGDMNNLPEGIPYLCLDIRQAIFEVAQAQGLTVAEIENKLPPLPDHSHTANNDAHWIKKAYEHIEHMKKIKQ